MEKLLQNKWYENEKSIWLLTTYEMRRNLKTHPFTHKLSAEYKNKTGEMLADTCQNHPFLKKAHALSLNSLSPEDKQLFFEYFLPPSDFSRYHGGEYFLLNPKEPCYVGIHLEDHLTFYWLDIHQEIEESSTKAFKLEKELSENLEFAFDVNFGFLTSDPRRSGIALTLSIFLHLPALVHTEALSFALQKVNSNFFEIQNLGKTKEQPLADFFIIRNRHSFALTEETLLKSMRRLALELSLQEQKKRDELTESETRALKDKVGKAYGMLQHASRLSLDEALSSISLCKLGHEMKWISGLSLKEMNTLFFTLRKGMLSLHHPAQEELSIEELRAQYLKKAFLKSKMSLS